jgi:tetratricopeptide (TPR) repeat protein
VNRIEVWISTLLLLLELLGILIALFAVVVILLGIIRSIVRVTFGRAILVLPFTGGETGAPLHHILTEQLDMVEGEARRIYSSLIEEAKSAPAASSNSLVDVGPLGSTALHELVESPKALDRAEEYIAADPVNLSAVNSLTFAGITVSPESIFAISYYLRSRFARRTINGSIYDFGDTVRLIVSTLPPSRKDKKGRRKDGATHSAKAEPIVIQRKIDSRDQILELVNDMAFKLLRQKFNLTKETESWAAWVAFQNGYTEHISFVREGDRSHRDRAIAYYSNCVGIDPRFARAHYNLGNLLYDQYLLTANREAIKHFLIASDSPNRTVRALACAGLTMAYAQNVHRFQLDPSVWIDRANSASKTAISLEPDLEETAFARAWSLQISDRVADAIMAYEAVVSLRGESPSELQIKSFALNNEAWLYLHKLGDLNKAEALLQRALKNPNKNIFANLGEVRRRQGRFQEALEMYRNATELDPMYANGINETGIVFLSMAHEARRNAKERKELIAHAYDLHIEALRVVKDKAEKVRLRRTFESSRSENGFSRIAVTVYSRRANQVASARTAESLEA